MRDILGRRVLVGVLRLQHRYLGRRVRAVALGLKLRAAVGKKYVVLRAGSRGDIDGELVAECYGCQAKLNKTKEDVARCRTLVAGKKMTGLSGTGNVRIYNATSRLITAESAALKSGKDLRHTIITNLDDPDNPSNQRIALKEVSFDDLTLADWEAAKLGTIEAPFTFDDWEVIDA